MGVGARQAKPTSVFSPVRVTPDELRDAWDGERLSLPLLHRIRSQYCSVRRETFTLEESVERLRAARRAIDRAGADTQLVARAECFHVGRPDLHETIARLRAYAGAGADCLYAPGLRSREEIVAVEAAVAPKPVNLLVGWASELTAAGGRGIGGTSDQRRRRTGPRRLGRLHARGKGDV
jgi:hypothetical protein